MISFSFYNLSMLPLLISVLIKMAFNVNSNECNIKLIIYAEIVIITFFIIVSFVRFFQFINNKNLSNYFKVKNIKNTELVEDIEVVYLVSIVIPMIAFNFIKLDDNIIFIIFYLVIYYLYSSNNIFFTNLLFNVCGYKIYKIKECETIKKNKFDNVYFLTKEEIFDEDEVYIKGINKKFYIARKNL